MALTEDEVKALRSIIKEELQAELLPFREAINRRFDAVANQIATLLRRHELFRDQVNRRFDEVATQIDGLYKHDETREQEYLFIKEQIRRLESDSRS